MVSERLISNFFRKKEYSDVFIASSLSLMNTPCSVAIKGVPYLYFKTKAGMTGKPDIVKCEISTLGTSIERGIKKRYNHLIPTVRSYKETFSSLSFLIVSEIILQNVFQTIMLLIVFL